MKNIVGLLFVLLFQLTLWASDFRTVPFDGIPYKFTTSGRVIAIGDLHGDRDALLKILKAQNLIDSKNRWIGADAHVVINGDLVDRGEQSADLLDYIIDLQIEAETKGGKVHVNIGNHENLVTQGDLRYMSAADKQVFSGMGSEDGRVTKESIMYAFTGNSKYAKFFRELNAITIINDVLYVHAGLSDWALSADLGEVNSTVRAWMGYLQFKFSPVAEKVRERPPEKTQWVIDRDNSPLWTLRLGILDKVTTPHWDPMPLATLEKIMTHIGVKHIVIGHIRQEDGILKMNHPTYGDRVIQTDTGNSSFYGRRMSALVVENNGALKAWQSESLVQSCLKFFKTKKP